MKKNMKRWLIPLIFFCALILFLPSLLSTPFGKTIAEKILETKTKGKIEIGSLHLSWLGPQEIDEINLLSPNLSGSCKQLVAHMPLWRAAKLKGLFTVEKGKLLITADSGEKVSLEEMQVELDGSQFRATGSSRVADQTGSFSLEGSITKFPKDFQLQGKVVSFPCLILDGFFHFPYKLTEILGSSLDVEGSIQGKERQGSLDIVSSFPNGYLNAEGDFDGKVFRPKRALIASCQLSPALSHMLMKDVNPLFLTAVSSQNPVTIKIFPEDTVLPYAPFHLKTLSIGQAFLDMGKVYVEKGESLQSVLDLLNSRRMKNNQQMEAWFTPVSFQLQNGLLQTGRLDALLSRSIHICSWGSVNLLSEKLHMYLGLPADTLLASFGITGLPSDYVLKIPLRGTISHPELSTSSAAAQIASMAATQTLPIPKVGKLFEKVTKTVSQIKNDKDVPPANRPFPWER